MTLDATQRAQALLKPDARFAGGLRDAVAAETARDSFPDGAVESTCNHLTIATQSARTCHTHLASGYRALPLWARKHLESTDRGETARRPTARQTGFSRLRCSVLAGGALPDKGFEPNVIVLHVGQLKQSLKE